MNRGSDRPADKPGWQSYQSWAMERFYKHLAEYVIRPKRYKYSVDELKPEYEVEGCGMVRRVSLVVESVQGTPLYGSLYQAPGDICIVFLHGNTSNQMEGRFLVPLFYPLGISVCCFDFAGCGCSPGDFITVGYQEQHDVHGVLGFLEKNCGFREFLLWGRSMGAVSGILALPELPTVKAAVFDSPFATLDSMLTDYTLKNRGKLGRSSKFHLPERIVEEALARVKERILACANFSTSVVRPIDAIQRVSIPVLFMHGLDDSLIPPSHTELLYEGSRSTEKRMLLVPGEHNDTRPSNTLEDAAQFLCRAIGLDVSY